MTIDEKIYNGNLLGQLTILDRLEDIAKEEKAVNTLKAIEREKRYVERKLYQAPPLMNEEKK